MNKKKIIIVLICVVLVIVSFIGIFLVINNKKEDNKNEQVIVKEDITESTNLLDLDFDCPESTEDKSICKILYYDENGERVVITDKSPASVFTSFDKDVYYISNDNYIHIYNIDTKEDKKINIKIKDTEELSDMKINSKYLMIEYFEDTQNKLEIYNKNDLSKIDIDICSINGKMIKNYYVYRNCDNKISVYNISTKKDKIILDEEVIYLNTLVDKERVLLIPTGIDDIILYNLKEDKLENVEIERTEPEFNVILFKDNIITYTDSTKFYKYDINTKKTTSKQIEYDFDNSTIINNKLVYVYKNDIQEFDLLTLENKKIYTIDKKNINVENSKDNKIQFRSVAYNHNYVITKITDIGSKIDCDGECHGIVREKKEYYVYNYAKNTFKKLNIVETHEEET